MSNQAQSNSSVTPSLKSLEHAVFLSLQKTADLLMGQVADLLKEHGISPTQYNVLRILRGAMARAGSTGCGAEGMACNEIGQNLIKRDPDITRLLDRLELRGLISRTREAKDRRVITTRITTAGLELLRQLDKPVMDLHNHQLDFLGEEHLKQLLDLLEQVRARHTDSSRNTNGE
jgi:DNA-binding MarR family transcriptional regulator